jgi:hypothetical protein
VPARTASALTVGKSARVSSIMAQPQRGGMPAALASTGQCRSAGACVILFGGGYKHEAPLEPAASGILLARRDQPSSPRLWRKTGRALG